jgi:hypothetical protein
MSDHIHNPHTCPIQPEPGDTEMIITFKEIINNLTSDEKFERLLLFNRVFRGDEKYFVPATEFYKTEFFPWYEMQLRHYKVRSYKQSWDCDKYANTFQVFANICHSQNSPKKSEGIAVAEIHYLPDHSSTPHAINAVFVDQKELKFIEPQTPEFIKLSPREQTSITFMKF